MNILFDGNYLNGQKNGDGKEYNHDGELLFEGKYLNGEKLEGKEYEEHDNEELTKAEKTLKKFALKKSSFPYVNYYINVRLCNTLATND